MTECKHTPLYGKNNIRCIGRGTYGYLGIKTRSWGEGAMIEIGQFCSIADNVTIFLGGNHDINRVSCYPFGHINQNEFGHVKMPGHPATKGDVIIGNDVWISSGVTIMSGVVIGNGSVIAANSHVVKNIPPYSVVGGNPAKIIKNRFTSDVIDSLQKIQWWNWSSERIGSDVSNLNGTNVEEFIKNNL